MDELTKIDVKALVHLKGARGQLTAQQYRTLRGQVLAGDGDGAVKGLRKILLLNGTNAVKRSRT